MPLPAHDGPLVIVHNPGSGHLDAERARQALIACFDGVGRAHEFVPLGAAQGVEQAARRGAERARELGGVLVAVGGDGTLNAVAAQALAHGIAFGVVPQGTFNYFGRNHGIPQELAAAANALLRAVPRPVQVGRVNGAPFLVNASLGLYPTLLEDREAHKLQYGRSRFVAICSGLAALLREPRQLRLRIELEDGTTRELRTPTLFVGNNALQLDQVGIAEADAVARNRGRLAAIVVRPTSSLAMLGLALRGALGRLGDAEQVDSFAFRSMRVDPVGHRTLKVAFDGEVRRLVAPLEFDTSPQPLWLMLPPVDLPVAGS